MMELSMLSNKNGKLNIVKSVSLNFLIDVFKHIMPCFSISGISR